MSGGLIFFLSVVLVYVILAVNWVVKFVRSRLEKRSKAHYAREQTIPREKTTPYRKPRIDLERLFVAAENRFKRLVPADPVMGQRINRGSEKYFDRERFASEEPPTELEQIRDIWRKAGRKRRKDATATEPDAGG